MKLDTYKTSFDIIEQDLDTLSFASTQLSMMDDDEARTYALAIISVFKKFTTREQITELLLMGSHTVHEAACNFINGEIQRCQRLLDTLTAKIHGESSENYGCCVCEVNALCEHLDQVIFNSPEITELANDYNRPLMA